MKKWISFMMILFLAVIFVGCGDKPDKPNPKPNDPTEIKVTSIEVTGVKEELEEGESFTLEIKVLPENATNKNYRVAAVDTSVLKVEDKKVTALKGGETTLTVTPLGNTQLKKEFKITVKGKEAPIEIIKPETFTIGGKQEVEKGKTTALSITATPDKANKEATWSSSDESIATVNNGIVKGVELGEVTITATSTLNPLVKAEYKIKVIEKKEDYVKPTSIEITASETELYENSKLQLRATVYPLGANQNVVWEALRPEVATVNEKGLVTGIKEGTAYFVAHSEDGSVSSSKLKLKILKDDEISIVYPDLQGYQIVCMINTKFDPYGENYSGTDKLARQKAWDVVKERYNCDLLEQSFPADASWGPNRYKWIVSQAEVGQAQADFYQVPVGWLDSMITGNAIAQLDTYYSRWGKREMSPVQKQASTIRGKLYGVSEGTDTTAIYADLGIYYNYGMLEKLKIESPAKLFNEGNWNYTTFQNWVESAQALLPEGNVVLAGHPYYYWIGLTNAAGVKIADTVTGKVNIYDDAAINSADLLRTIYLSGSFEKTPTWAESDGAFISGTALCSTGFRWYCKSETRWASDVWGDDTRFGYVPFPWPDRSSKEASRVGTGGEEVVWTIATQRTRPTYATEEDLYRVMTDLFRLTRKYLQEDPSFDSDLIRQQVISQKIDDPESIEAMCYYEVDKAIVDVCHLFFDSISGCPLTGNAYNIVVSGNDYMTEQAADYENYENKFLGLYGLG